MDSDKSLDNWDLNYEKLCNEESNPTLSYASSEFHDVHHVNCPINGILQHKNSSTSLKSLKIRRINSAIYVEPLDIDSASGVALECPSKKSDITNLATSVSKIHVNGDTYSSFNTHRCETLISSRPSITSSANKSKSLSTIERRCKIDDPEFESTIDSEKSEEVRRYSVNGQQVVQISASLTNCSFSKRGSGSSSSKNQAYNEWIKKKKLETVRKKKSIEELEQEKKSKAEKLETEKAEKELLEQKNFMMWIEKKKAEDAQKRMIAEQQMEIERQLKELEDKTAIAKEICLKQWCRKKERERKEQRKKAEMRKKELEEERQRRLEESSKAFEKWREQAKNKPRPATQGLLPHQQAKPSYVNPIPWVVDEISTEEVEINSISSMSISYKSTSSTRKTSSSIVKKAFVQK